MALVLWPAYEGKEEISGDIIALPQFSESEGPQSSPSPKALISLLLL